MMNFQVYNQGKDRLRVAFFSKKTFGGSFEDEINLQKIAEYNNIEIHLFDTDDERFFKFGSVADHKLLDEDACIIRRYSFIIEYLKINNVSICIFFSSGFAWTKKFLDRLKEITYTACWFADDPEGSDYTSKPYVKNYMYSFCGGIYFNSYEKIADKYIEWGARKSKFIPLGALPSKCRFDNKIVKHEDRKIEIVYVGGCYFPKVFRMFKLKKHFGDRMKIYGRGWNESESLVKTLILKFIKFIYQIPQIEELPKDEFVELYQNTKVGFNMHMSHGPSNQRLYELPANGVLQVCDCEKGLLEIFNINEEVIAYKNISDAIKKIEYYLNNDNERIVISKAGYQKILKYFRTEMSFGKIIKEIKKDEYYKK